MCCNQLGNRYIWTALPPCCLVFGNFDSLGKPREPVVGDRVRKIERAVVVTAVTLHRMHLKNYNTRNLVLVVRWTCIFATDPEATAHGPARR